jgi:Ca2+-transporting ATPase
MKTEPLTATELAICMFVPATVVLAVEAEKWLVRRGLLYRPHRGDAVPVTPLG